ncbi:hypothetical protein DFH07DRAFT_549925 [Mycena maculata]|uniref:Uncharacterized protein n=1 Tax=Mycena maculata TaxID=230809 RepID=A0AAD7N8F6_9AGAR|nr:hypothetical protein DFH07DRAFT_549925 [Mycena maculata]
MSNIYDNNTSIIQAEINATDQLVNFNATVGLTMLASESNSTNARVAYYAIPSLKSDLANWKKNTSLIAFLWDPSNPNGTRVKSSAPPLGTGTQPRMPHVSRGGPSFIMADFGVQVQFGGIELVDIELGTWFDHFKSANSVANPISDDLAGAAYKKIFTKYFGTAEHPGDLAKYTYKALVVYKPIISLLFASEQNAINAKSAATSSCGMWQGLTNGTIPADKDYYITFNPNTTDAYVVGVIMQSYWDGQAASGFNFTSNTVGE